MRTNESSNKETRTVHIYSTLPVRRVRGYASHTFELARVYTTVNSPALPPSPHPFHRDRSARHWCARSRTCVRVCGVCVVRVRAPRSRMCYVDRAVTVKRHSPCCETLSGRARDKARFVEAESRVRYRQGRRLGHKLEFVSDTLSIRCKVQSGEERRDETRRDETRRDGAKRKKKGGKRTRRTAGG